ncbi:hypothetical protein SAMN05444166_4942 [Singulisphaera sp. GP187]|nr:hypothetical protein SAMN05444166_4942 [Singulisphaera sp. GP187]
MAISPDGRVVAAGGHLNDPRFGMIDLFWVKGRKLVPMRGKR